MSKYILIFVLLNNYTMEKEILNLMQKDSLSTNEQDIISNAIENGEVDSCDLFDNFVDYVSQNADITYETVMTYKENYETSLSHKENLSLLLGE